METSPEDLEHLTGLARAAWPQVELADALWRAHVQGAAARGAIRFPADLYLACACAHGVPAALQAFEDHHVAQISAATLRVSGSSALLDEVRQLVRERLLVRRPDAAPRIAEYTGQGPLWRFVRVTALRVALNLMRPGWREEGDLEAVMEAATIERDPELEYLKLRSATEFKAVLAEVLAGLLPETRNLLRMHLVDRLDSARLAVIFGRDRSTMSRRLTRTLDGLAEEVRRQLGQRLRLSDSELDSLRGMLSQQMDLSLSRLLS